MSGNSVKSFSKPTYSLKKIYQLLNTCARLVKWPPVTSGPPGPRTITQPYITTTFPPPQAKAPAPVAEAPASLAEAPASLAEAPGC